MARLASLFDSCLSLQAPQFWATVRQLSKSANAPMCFDVMAEGVRVAPSTKHGLGLFASTDMAAGTMASLYPVHSMGIGTQRISTAEDAEAGTWEEPCSAAYRTTLLHTTRIGPVQEWAQGAYVDADPARPHLAGWVAHLATDAAVCAGGSDKEILEYYAAGADECNCLMVPFGGAAPVMALVTTRAVQPGEELLVSYGHSYWIDHFGGTVPAHASRAVTLAAAAPWGVGGLKANVAQVVAAYPNEMALLEGLLMPESRS